MPFSSFSARARHPRYPEHWKRISSRRVTAVGSWTDFGNSGNSYLRSTFRWYRHLRSRYVFIHLPPLQKSVSYFCAYFYACVNTSYELCIWFGKSIGHLLCTEIRILYVFVGKNLASFWSLVAPQPSPKRVQNRKCYCFDLVLGRVGELRRLQKLLKNKFSIENIKIPDFGAQQMLYTLTRSNIKSTGSVYAYEINYTKGGKTFWRVPNRINTNRS